MVFFVFISVNAFADPAKLLFSEINKNKLQVIEMKMDGSDKKVIYEDNDVGKSGPFPIAFKDELLLFQSETSFIYDLKKKEITKLDCSENCYVIGFFKTKPYIVLETGSSNEDSQVVIYDYNAKTKVKEYPDRYAPRIACADDTVFSQKYRKILPDDSQTNKGITGYIDLYRVISDSGKEELVRTIELTGNVRYDVKEISAFSKELYAYRVYDEHEYRYYVYDGKEERPFYNAGHGYYLDHKPREQYALKFSADGKYAAYAERPWNELTCIFRSHSAADSMNIRPPIPVAFGH